MSAQEEEDDANERKELNENFVEDHPSKGADLASSSAVNMEEQHIHNTKVRNFCSGWVHIIYISIFSVIGVTARAFIGRFFGGDCDPNNAVKDWLYPLSHRICVTTNGRTEQYGGALFIDLPVNMFGSFIIGFFTGHSSEWPAIPFLKHDHPLQGDEGLHLGIRTALCGSLTTFSSWNSQMVLMMDGTANPYLGTQVISALFGYVIGMQVSIVSFHTGRTLSSWFQNRSNPHLFDSNLIRTDSEIHRCNRQCYWLSPVTFSLSIVIIFALYIWGDVYWGINFYREMWIACLMAPLGTITRWKLSTFNGKWSKYPWFPLGTWLANFSGSIISAVLTAVSFLHLVKGADGVDVLAGLSLGFAGSLSTVSTYVKETVELSDKNPFYDKKAFLYSYFTILSCCFVGLLVYCPIVRYAG
jgi:fluoride ion exporter CrcB/FEX